MIKRADYVRGRNGSEWFVADGGADAVKPTDMMKVSARPSRAWMVWKDMLGYIRFLVICAGSSEGCA